jgi:hypothetical protein
MTFETKFGVVPLESTFPNEYVLMVQFLVISVMFVLMKPPFVLQSGVDEISLVRVVFFSVVCSIVTFSVWKTSDMS